MYRNAVYATKQIQDPWSPHTQEISDLWVRINYEKEAVEVLLANHANGDHNKIFPKLKHGWSSLENVGGKVNPVEVAPSIFGVQVHIPYAGYLHKL